jgi:hypothetical protein
MVAGGSRPAAAVGWRGSCWIRHADLGGQPRGPGASSRCSRGLSTCWHQPRGGDAVSGGFEELAVVVGGLGSSTRYRASGALASQGGRGMRRSCTGVGAGFGTVMVGRVGFSRKAAAGGCSRSMDMLVGMRGVWLATLHMSVSGSVPRVTGHTRGPAVPGSEVEGK